MLTKLWYSLFHLLLRKVIRENVYASNPHRASSILRLEARDHAHRATRPKSFAALFRCVNDRICTSIRL